ncbi:hypothetical protein [Bacillus sp. ISL-4]|nr:hypothetical protein [Bacillus sp. ISL-4]
MIEATRVFDQQISAIERCMNRVKVVYANNPENLKDYTKQDSIILTTCM